MGHTYLITGTSLTSCLYPVHLFLLNLCLQYTSTTNTLIGANRGLGIEFVKQLSADSSNTILACSRDLKSDANSDLQSLSKKYSGKVHILECDISNLDSVASAKKQVESILGGDAKIDYLLNNA